MPLAPTGLFGTGEGEEVDRSEWVDLCAPDTADYMRSLPRPTDPLPPGVTWEQVVDESARRQVAGARPSCTGTAGVVQQETGLRASFYFTAQWMIGVARGELANQRRARQRRLAATDRLREELRGSVPSATDGSDAVADPVREALDRLDAADREVLTLTYWEGLTADQVGQVVGLSPAATRKRLQRARARVAAQLERDGAALVTPHTA